CFSALSCGAADAAARRPAGMGRSAQAGFPGGLSAAGALWKRQSGSRRRKGVIVLVLSRADVEAVLDLDRLLDPVDPAMADLTHGRASMPPRVAAPVPDRHAMLAAMPAFLPSTGSLCAKLVSLFPENTSLPTHQAIICCFDAASGTPAALMDGTYVTAARTAAGSALATRLLAPAGASAVSVIRPGIPAP